MRFLLYTVEFNLNTSQIDVPVYTQDKFGITAKYCIVFQFSVSGATNVTLGRVSTQGTQGSEFETQYHKERKGRYNYIGKFSTKPDSFAYTFLPHSL